MSNFMYMFCKYLKYDFGEICIGYGLTKERKVNNKMTKQQNYKVKHALKGPE